MNDADVKVHGYRELQAGSRVLAARIATRAPRDIAPVAEEVRRRVAGRVPRRSGRLAGSLDVHQASGGVGVGYTGAAEYAGWIDFGGGRYRGRPYTAAGRYLYPAATHVDAALDVACSRGAHTEIGAMVWPTPAVL